MENTKPTSLEENEARGIAEILSRGAANPSEFERYFRQINELMCYYQCAIMEVETKFRVLEKQLSMHHDKSPIDSIQTRLKSTASIMEKVQRRNLDVTSIETIEKNIHDIAGVRVICSFIDDVYELAKSFADQDDITVLEVKDYIKNPKPNGYRSLHIIVEVPIFLKDEKRMMKVEVQMRTIAMEFWSNLEHKMRYKKSMSEKVRRETEDELFACAELSAELDRRMQEVFYIIEND